MFSSAAAVRSSATIITRHAPLLFAQFQTVRQTTQPTTHPPNQPSSHPPPSWGIIEHHPGEAARQFYHPCLDIIIFLLDCSRVCSALEKEYCHQFILSRRSFAQAPIFLSIEQIFRIKITAATGSSVFSLYICTGNPSSGAASIVTTTGLPDRIISLAAAAETIALVFVLEQNNEGTCKSSDLRINGQCNFYFRVGIAYCGGNQRFVLIHH